jgi:hypothetical protein
MCAARVSVPRSDGEQHGASIPTHHDWGGLVCVKRTCTSAGSTPSDAAAIQSTDGMAPLEGAGGSDSAGGVVSGCDVG